jgi:hypothetical protein
MSALGGDDGDGARRCSSSISAGGGGAAGTGGVAGVGGASAPTSRGSGVVRAIGEVRTTGAFGGGGVGGGGTGSDRWTAGVSGPTSSMERGIAIGARRGASVLTDVRSPMAIAWTAADVHTGQPRTRDD